MRDDFAIFILTHGRPQAQYTVRYLQEHIYTGKWYLILDNEDSTIDEYKRLYGEEHVIVFDRIKQAENEEFDICDRFMNKGRNSVVYARNKCFEIAKNLGLKWFFEYEDDYSEFKMRYSPDGVSLTAYILNNFDLIIDAMIEYMEECPQITTIAMSQQGDWIGGTGSQMWKDVIKRKAMNTFLCNVDRPFTFIGRMNDDVNTYVTEGARGMLFLTFRDLCMHQQETQKTGSGNTEMYQELGTYIKSFYSVMVSPSSVKIDMMGLGHRRIHHNINWEVAVPKIISSKFKV